MNQKPKPKWRRHRVPRSCDRCRISKVKCVFQDDCCRTCAKLGLPCILTHPGSLQEKPPKVKEIEKLAARVRSLERLLQAVDPTIDINHLPDPNRLVSNCHKALHAPIELSVAGSRSHIGLRSNETSDQDSNQSQIWDTLIGIHGLRVLSKPAVTQVHWTQSDKSRPMSKCVGATISSEHYIGPNSGLSITEPATWGIPPLPPWDCGDSQYPVDEHLRLCREEFVPNTNKFYPEPDLERHLLKIYFQHIHPLVPVVHPTAFRTLLNSGLAHRDSSFRALCLFMFALASRWSSDPRTQLDLTGRPLHSRQCSGLHFAWAGYVRVFKLGNDRTTLFDLQAYVLMIIGSLAAVQPAVSWILVEQGLLRAQECGAHREVHHLWNADPIQDYLRRQAFFQLYEMGLKISYSLNRTPSVREDNFDVEPAHVSPGDPLGIFVNPYTNISPEVHDLCVRYDRARVLMWQLGSLRSMFPLLGKMQASTKEKGDAASFKSLKALVDLLELNVWKWYDKVSPIFKRPDIGGSAELLMFSVIIVTCYQKFQIFIHRALFHYQEGDPNHQTIDSYPHVTKCAELAISWIEEINKLRLRSLLIHGFYWLPADLMLVTIILACSIRKQVQCLSPHQHQLRRNSILLAITILDDLAPYAHTAAEYSKTAKIIFRFLDQANPSLTGFFKSLREEDRRDKSQATDASRPQASPTRPGGPLDPVALMGVNYASTDRQEGSWDPLEISTLTFGAVALHESFSTTLHHSPDCLPVHPVP